jgi:hypothetical protein
MRQTNFLLVSLAVLLFLAVPKPILAQATTSKPQPAPSYQLHLPLTFLTSAGSVSPVETDDTNFATSTEGFILFADKGLNTVYKLTTPAFAPGTAYTAADGGPFVGTLNLSTG